MNVHNHPYDYNSSIRTTAVDAIPIQQSHISRQRPDHFRQDGERTSAQLHYRLGPLDSSPSSKADSDRSEENRQRSTSVNSPHAPGSETFMANTLGISTVHRRFGSQHQLRSPAASVNEIGTTTHVEKANGNAKGHTARTTGNASDPHHGASMEWFPHDSVPSHQQAAQDRLNQRNWPYMLPEELSAMSEAEWKTRFLPSDKQDRNQHWENTQGRSNSSMDSSPSSRAHLRGSAGGQNHPSSLSPGSTRAPSGLATSFNTSLQSISSDPAKNLYSHLSSNRDGISLTARGRQTSMIFVAGLHPELQEEDLLVAFLDPPPFPCDHPLKSSLMADKYDQSAHSRPAPFGSTLTANIVSDERTGISKGFGYVTFSEAHDCSRAMVEMQGVIVGPNRSSGPGCPLRISYAGSQGATTDDVYHHNVRQTEPFNLQLSYGDSVNVSPFPTTTAWSAIDRAPHRSSIPAAAEMAKYSIPVSSPPSWPEGVPSLPGFPTIPATGALGPVDVSLRSGVSSATSWSGPASLAGTGFTLGPSTLPSPSSALDPKNTTVFVGGLSSLISEDTLKTFFAPFGAIAYVKIPPGKGCGFVSFVLKADAEKAIERMQGFPVGGCRIRLSWGRSQGEKSQHLAQQQMNSLQQLANWANVGDWRHLKEQQLAHLANLSQVLVDRTSPSRGPASTIDLLAASRTTTSPSDHASGTSSGFSGSQPQEVAGVMSRTAPTGDTRMSATSRPFEFNGHPSNTTGQSPDPVLSRNMAQLSLNRGGDFYGNAPGITEPDHRAQGVWRDSFNLRHPFDHTSSSSTGRMVNTYDPSNGNAFDAIGDPYQRLRQASVASEMPYVGQRLGQQHDIALRVSARSDDWGSLIGSNLFSPPTIPIQSEDNLDGPRTRPGPPARLSGDGSQSKHSAALSSSGSSSLAGNESSLTSVSVASAKDSFPNTATSTAESRMRELKSYCDRDLNERLKGFSPFSPLLTPEHELTAEEVEKGAAPDNVNQQQTRLTGGDE